MMMKEVPVLCKIFSFAREHINHTFAIKSDTSSQGFDNIISIFKKNRKGI